MDSAAAFAGQSVLITGGTGSWGHELVQQLLNQDVSKIRIYSRGELAQVQMARQFQKQTRAGQLEFTIGDVRDREQLTDACRGIDIVYHLAALKHVPLCERQPLEALKTNVGGTRNLIAAARKTRVERVVHVSTDKAVQPLNFYGLTKAIAEKMVVKANDKTGEVTGDGPPEPPKDPRLIVIRAGNVLGTNGSVVPLFRQQLEAQNRVTVTDERMTRYFLTLPQAIQLLFKATREGIGGETFVFNMPSCRITDLADVLIDAWGDENSCTETIGIRPGEKLHEMLISPAESRRTRCFGDGFYVILPHQPQPELRQKYRAYDPVPFDQFTSQDRLMTRQQLQRLLAGAGFIDEARAGRSGRSQASRPRILVLGAHGMAGHMIRSYLDHKSPARVFATHRDDILQPDEFHLDVRDRGSAERIIRRVNPDVVVNATGILIEESRQHPDRAMAVNALFPHQLAVLSQTYEFKLIHLSTDCVFSGRSGGYKETDPPDASDPYGRSKAAGELRSSKHLTFRTSIIGPERRAPGRGLFEWIMRQKGDVPGYVRVRWTGVTTLKLAQAIEAAIEQELTGLYHLVPNQTVTKYDLLRLMVDIFERRDINLIPVAGKSVDKSLVNTRSDFEFAVPDYATMLQELKAWMNVHGWKSHV